MSELNPFVRDAGVDQPGIIGARWWNKSLQDGGYVVGRRSALTSVLLVGGGILAVGGLTAWAVSNARMTSDDEREERKRSLDMQKDYGWSFGAESETVAYDAQFTQTYAREALKTLEEDLAPSAAAHRPFYAPALFQSPEALPRLTLPGGETARVKPLAEALRPVRWATMDTANAVGRALAKLLGKASGRTMLLVDLAGPESVAFAAGAANAFDPIFVFDNWPHPKGVVPAHKTLGAAVYYQPVFRRAREERGIDAPPMVILDRGRLTFYSDDETQFDNRYLPKVPLDLKALGVENVLYVVPTPYDLPEPDDLNEALSGMVDASTNNVRAIALNAFEQDPRGGGEWLFGTPAQHEAFFGVYPFDAASASAPTTSHLFNKPAADYRPKRRLTKLPTGNEPPIGSVPVLVGVATGAVIAARLARNGTANRTGYNSWGGG